MGKKFSFLLAAAVLAAGAAVLLLPEKTLETGSWGLSFRQEGAPPVAPAESNQLAKYDAAYLGDPGEKTIYLTFDAGYENGCTEKILDVLQEHQVPAAFFLVGNYMERNPDLVKRMAAEGHVIGNHTLNHVDMTTLSDLAAYRKQVEGWNELLAGYGIEPSGYFRFPCGRFSARALDYNEQLGLTSVFWSFAYYDWVEEDQPAPDAALQKILSRMHDGCILLLHSTSKTNATILGELIDQLRTEGYEIVPLEQMKSA